MNENFETKPSDSTHHGQVPLAWGLEPALPGLGRATLNGIIQVHGPYPMNPPMRNLTFNEHKVAQMAAYLLQKPGGRMPHLKLMKLMYLADREAYDRLGRPISGDRAVSMPHGPVLSQTLNLMDGDVESAPDGWCHWISDKENNELSLNRAVDRTALGELSDAEIEILDHVYAKYGHMGKWQIRDFSHTLPEWADPQGSSLPISTQDIFKALGKGAEAITGMVARLDEDRAIDAFFASL